MKPREIAGLIVALASAVGFALLLLTGEAPGTSCLGATAVARTVAGTGAINVVTGVLLDFRAFDTLGEASVIFASVAAVSAAFAGSGVSAAEPGLGLLVRRSVSYLVPLFLLFPLYIMLHGHLSPGGGFQGGVSLAVLLILLAITFGTGRTTRAVDPHMLHRSEALSAAAFAAIGLVAVIQGVGFLTNLAAGFPPGRPGQILSGGFIPLLNLVIGVKVASGLGTIYYELLSTRAG
ncbi:MAG: hydrogen gas-evolving membrane-bound hydrogenase subunit E [Spirochaetaceae bacterium]